MAAFAVQQPQPIGRPNRRAFAEAIRGLVLDPASPEYEAARQVHNAAFDRHPALVVRPADALDVARAVDLATEADLPIAVRSGGHSLAGHGTGDGAVVIDLSSLKGLHIDPVRKLAWARPGLTAGEYTAATHEHGLATPFGDTASVGLGGLTLGGGIGWLVRKHGLTIDSLVSAELVTADGRLVTASANENPDLFWAIRGGGGNFGVVTRFQYRLHEVDMVTGGMLVLPATRDVLRGLVPIAAEAPDDLSLIAFVMHAPPLPFIPPEQVGRLVVMAMLVHVGDPDAGQAAVAPFLSLATPIADLVGPMPYPAIYEFTKSGEARSAASLRSAFLPALTDASVDAILDHLEASTSPAAMVQLRVLGGAMAAVPSDATAFAFRDAPVMATIITPYEGPAAPHEAWTTSLFEAIRPGAVGVYANFLGDEGEARIREAYPSPTYARLAEVKRRWDPDNRFRLNQNIRPATGPVLLTPAS